MEIWKNVPGNNIYQLRQDPRFPDKPDASLVIRNMATPVNKMDNYGVRLTAYYKVRTASSVDYNYLLATSFSL